MTSRKLSLVSKVTLAMACAGLAAAISLPSTSAEAYSAPKAQKSAAAETNGKTCEVAVEGMTCKACVEAVTKELQKIKGAENIKVVLSENKARLFVRDAEASVLAQVEQAIKAAGFKPGKAEFVAGSGTKMN
jgi:Cu+-exporting ATPase